MHAPNPLLSTVVIVGGGTAGWMTATALATVLRGRYNIRLVESDDIGTVGVGEATLPPIRHYNRRLGIAGDDFMRRTQATFKLGIEFVNWGRPGERYVHGFGKIGQDLWTVRFDQYWQKLRQQGRARELMHYSITRMACAANKFMPATTEYGNSPLADIAHAYHFDAGLYARFLRGLAEQRGVQRTEGKVTRVLQREHDGHVTAVVLENGEHVAGELFIDCSGFRGLLIQETLKTGFEDWTHWLPCNRALAVPCASAPVLTPYTRATAHGAGWQWRIPLQHRTGNGHVYCSDFISDDEAAATLLAGLDGAPLADPRPLRFTTGMRRQAWNRNVVAIGLSGGFLEPLESTSIHLIQAAIQRLIDFFPDQGFSDVDRAEFNRQSRFDYESVRDFVILHYKQTQRRDTAFWRHCADMAVPDTLQHKMDLYAAHGRLLRFNNELFAEDSWLQVFEGQNLVPRQVHPLASLQPDDEVADYLESVRGVIAQCVAQMPDHQAYIDRHCKAPPLA